MKHMKHEYKKKDALLREHKESTLEKNEKKRNKRREILAKEMSKVVKDPF